MRRYVIIKIKVLCPRSGSHRKVKQNDKLLPVQDSGSLAVLKVTARDLGHYKGPSGAFVTYCNIFFNICPHYQCAKPFRLYKVCIAFSVLPLP